LETFIEDKAFIFESLKALIQNNRVLVEEYINNLLLSEEVKKYNLLSKDNFIEIPCERT